jgi:acid phosphatase (class A)
MHSILKQLAGSLTMLSCVVLSVVLTGCAASAPPAISPSTDPAVIGEGRPGSGYLKGYMLAKDYPNSLALLPPPPTTNSPAQAADNHAYEASKKLREGARAKMAFDDNELKFPAAAGAFSCAMGLPITLETTPHTTILLRRSLIDAGVATYSAKNHYQRTRPFVVNKHSTCAPKEEEKLAKDGSYPSGHAALGWAWALILAEVSPERADTILQRGLAFGQSRAICGVHWQSDVDAGRLVGSAAVAKLHANETFNAQMAAAKIEIAQARQKLVGQTTDPAKAPLCSAEAAAIASEKK